MTTRQLLGTCMFFCYFKKIHTIIQIDMFHTVNDISQLIYNIIKMSISIHLFGKWYIFLGIAKQFEQYFTGKEKIHSSAI